MRVSGVLPYFLEEDDSPSGMTARAGLMPYLDLMQVARVGVSAQCHIQLRNNGQGWTPAQLVTTLVLLNLSGGMCVDDLQGLNKDEGLNAILARTETQGMTRQQRREQERRFRKGQARRVASPSVMRRFLEEFRNEEEEAKRGQGRAFIPAANEHLKGVYQVNWDLVTFAQQRRPQKVATLDIDAVVIETSHQEALYSYEGTRAYQPLNIYWAEQHLILHSEFRDGNVPAGHEIKRVLSGALEQLPPGVEEIYVRSDTAAYQVELLRYLDSSADGKKRIRFAIGADVSKSLKEEIKRCPPVWQPLTRGEAGGIRDKTGQEWAEVGYVPSSLAYSKNDPEFRFLAIREPVAQPTLPGLEPQKELPFPTVEIGGTLYKLHVVVTNLDWEAPEIIHWYRQRCGKSEEAHAVMQHDLAGGQMPSKHFGANAAWWAMMILALNLNEIMKRMILGGKWAEKRLKAIRYQIINTPGRVLLHARQLILRVSKGCSVVALIAQMRQGIAALATAPAPG